MMNQAQFQTSLTSILERLRTGSDSELGPGFEAALRELVTGVPIAEREVALRAVSAWSMDTLPPSPVSRAVGAILAEHLATLHGRDVDSDAPAFPNALPVDAPLPTHITTTSARELYGLQPGETLVQALERSHGEAPR